MYKRKNLFLNEREMSTFWSLLGFPGGSEVKPSAWVCLQCGRPGFDPSVGKIPWRRKWQPNPVFLPGESHGRRSLVDYSQWGPKESDTTEQLHFHFSFWNCQKVVLERSAWKKSYDPPRQHIKKQRYYFANKGPSSQGYDFSSSHVWMWELDYKESWVPKNWCCWTVVLDKTLESPLSCKEIQPVHPKGNQSWIFIGRTDAEAETPTLWPPDVKNRLIGKDPDAGKDWRLKEKGMTEGEMVGWHHRLNGHEFE